MKRTTILFITIFFTVYLSNAQISIYDAVQTGKEISKGEKNPNKLPPKFIQTVEFGSSLPSEIKYYFSTDEYFSAQEFKRRLSFELFYNINYPIIRKLTLGAVVGIQHQSQQSITGLKLGATLRYYFRNYEGVNMYVMTARSIGISDNVKNEGGEGNIRFGLQFPIIELEDFDDFRVTFNVFWDNDSYAIKKPLLGNETPDNMVFRSAYGLAIGLQF